MKKGKVKFYNEEKGFGFITSDDTGEEIFFHVSSIKGGSALSKDDKVSFELGEGKKGPMGKNISKI